MHVVQYDLVTTHMSITDFVCLRKVMEITSKSRREIPKAETTYTHTYILYTYSVVACTYVRASYIHICNIYVHIDTSESVESLESVQESVGTADRSIHIKRESLVTQYYGRMCLVSREHATATTELQQS